MSDQMPTYYMAEKANIINQHLIRIDDGTGQVEVADPSLDAIQNAAWAIFIEIAKWRRDPFETELAALSDLLHVNTDKAMKQAVLFFAEHDLDDLEEAL